MRASVNPGPSTAKTSSSNSGRSRSHCPTRPFAASVSTAPQISPARMPSPRAAAIVASMAPANTMCWRSPISTASASDRDASSSAASSRPRARPAPRRAAELAELPPREPTSCAMAALSRNSSTASDRGRPPGAPSRRGTPAPALAERQVAARETPPAPPRAAATPSSASPRINVFAPIRNLMFAASSSSPHAVKSSRLSR